MLMAGASSPPTQVWAHGYLTVGGKKMSKTRLTGIHPFELIDHFGVDSVPLLLRARDPVRPGRQLPWEAMVDRHNADLANGLGNLVSRVLAMLGSYFDGVVPEPATGAADDLPSVIEDAVRRYDEHMSVLALSQALGAVWDVIGRANGYLVEREPWKVAGDEARRDELAGILYAAAETLRILAILIRPIMPGAAGRLWEQLGIERPLEDQRLPEDAAWGGLSAGTKTTKGDPLFPPPRLLNEGSRSVSRGTRLLDRESIPDR